MLELADLRAFVRIADLGSLSAAARALDAPKSSLSRALVRLEAAVGSALIERSTRVLRLTDAGVLLRPHAVRLLNDADEALAAIEGLSGVPCGLLRVNVSPAFAQGLLAPMLPAFLARHPEVRVALDVDSRQIDMMANGTDLVIRVGPLADSGLIARSLPSVELWLCASPAYLAAKGTPTGAGDLAGHDLVAREEATTWTFRHTGGNVETINVRPQAILPDAGAVSALLVAGGGIGRLPEYWVRPALTRGDLVRVLPDLHVATVELHALYPSHRSLSAKVRVFIDVLVEHMRAMQRKDQA